MAQITQTNTASCIISQRKTGGLRLRMFCCFGVCLRKSARSAGDILGFFVQIDGVLLRVILPQIAQITQITQRKDMLGEWIC